MKFFGLTAILATCVASVMGEPVVLTDANFAHTTQVGQGMTTGSWFVKFYAPWCGHCKKLEPTWNELADALKGDVNVGKLDATTNGKTAQHFKIKGYPTLLFFKDNMQYVYTGPRSLDSLKEFALDGYKKAEGEALPQPPSFIRRMLAGTPPQIQNFPAHVTTIVREQTVAGAFLLSTGLVAGIPLGMFVAVMILKPKVHRVEKKQP